MKKNLPKEWTCFTFKVMKLLVHASRWREEQLLEERNKLNNFQKIKHALTISYAALNGEDDSSLIKSEQV